jgi:hypothetical protein
MEGVGKAPWIQGPITDETEFRTICTLAGWDKEDRVKANARAIAQCPNLIALARKVAAHFEYTDAPLGKEARAILRALEREG